MSQTKSGIELIAAERERQMQQEKWTADHDDQHIRGELAEAGLCYALLGACQTTHHLEDKASEMDPPSFDLFQWPWDDEWWKPSDDQVRNLVKSGALIAAEIGRLQRKSNGRKPVSTTLAG